jgi:uncharacterized protein YacL
MQIYYPAIIASAIFFASIVINLRDKNNYGAFITSLIAIPTVIFIIFLSQKNLDIIAYILILVPIILVFIGYSIGIRRDDTGAPATPNRVENEKTTPTNPKVPDRIEPVAGTFTCDKCIKYPCICRFVNNK